MLLDCISDIPAEEVNSLVALNGDFQLICANEKNSNERCQVARQTVVYDKILTHIDRRFFQHSLINTEEHRHTDTLRLPDQHWGILYTHMKLLGPFNS